MKPVAKVRFVSERITPSADAFEGVDAPIGEPLFPMRFRWRKEDYEVVEILSQNKELGLDATHGSSEKYVRKHTYKILTRTGEIMNIYFERQARVKGQPKARWFLYTIEVSDS